MALNTLRDIPTSARARILTALAGYFLPSPVTEPAALKLPTEGQESVVLDEVLEKIHLKRGNLTSATRSAILEELYNNIVATLTDEKTLAARQRLGMSGDLRPDLYRLQFPKIFSIFENLGTRRTHVEAAIRKPDAFQHLLPERIRTYDDEPLVSLFLKRMKSKVHNPFFLLVQARRKNDIQIVGNSWRLYDSDVSLPRNGTPLEYLRAFVQVYGIPFRIGQYPETRFVLHEAIPVVPNIQNQNLITFANARESDVFVTSFIRRSELNVAEVAIAYIIDLVKYKKTLHRHKVIYKVGPIPGE